MNPGILAFAVLISISCNTLAGADGPDYWRVKGVEEGSHLNLRKGPSKEFSVIGKITHNATGLVNLGCFPDFNMREWSEFSEHEANVAKQLRWCRVSFENLEGWVFAQYLFE